MSTEKDQRFRSFWTYHAAKPPTRGSFVPPISAASATPAVPKEGSSSSSLPIDLRMNRGAHLLDTENAPLMNALFACDSLEVFRLISEDPSCVNEKDSNCHHPALTLACGIDNSLPIIELMVKKGASPNTECTKGHNALAASLLCYKSFPTPLNLKKFHFLLDRVSHVDPVTPKPCVSALEEAVQIGDVSIVKAILDKGADVNLLLYNDRIAINLAKSPEIVQLLIEKGSKVDHIGAYGGPPLYNAVTEGHLEIAKLLIDAGADLELRYLGSTPLHHATAKGNSSMIRLLLDSGANVEEEGLDGLTPFMKACQYSLTTLQVFIEKGANLNRKSHNGTTPLFQAVHRDDSVVVKLLLDAGADPELGDNNGYQPLDHALDRSKIEVARLLLDAGASLEKKEEPKGAAGNQHYRPYVSRFLSACYCSRLEVIRFLVEKGVDINQRDASGWTPLHVAANGGNYNVVRLLLELGAEVNPEARYTNSTPLDLAKSPEVIEVLIQAGGEKKDRIAKPLPIPSTPAAVALNDTPTSPLEEEIELVSTELQEASLSEPIVAINEEPQPPKQPPIITAQPPETDSKSNNTSEVREVSPATKLPPSTATDPATVKRKVKKNKRHSVAHFLRRVLSSSKM